MKKTVLLLLAVACFAIVKSQTNIFPSTGFAGIGTIAPAYKLHAVSPTSNSYVIGVTGLDFVFNPNLANGALGINPAIAIPEIGAGLVNFNDGYVHTLGCVINNKLIWNVYGNAYYKAFRINAMENNYENFTLEFRNNGSSVYAAGDWMGATNTSVIAAWNHGLNIGSRSGFPVKLFSDGYNSAHAADIFIQNFIVGIGTETPNQNARLDVNGNIYSNGKIFIGTPDAGTVTKIAPYSLAVNGTAIFNKAIVKLYASWPDYVFSSAYKLPSLKKLENFIKLNKHLPEVPSASDVEKNGIDLGDNQALLLKKIEELTLIVIEQNKRIEKQSEKIVALENHFKK